MAGAYQLAWELQRAAGDHRAAFAAYQAAFKPFLDEKQRAAEGFAWWMAPKTRLGVRLRNLTTNLMNLPFLAGPVARRSFTDHFVLPD
jgi:2-polyprenyl-6-methoxyphenol hydroxylase-like FAD-dependent oxidoreductase